MTQNNCTTHPPTPPKLPQRAIMECISYTQLDSRLDYKTLPLSKPSSYLIQQKLLQHQYQKITANLTSIRSLNYNTLNCTYSRAFLTDADHIDTLN